MADDTSGVWVEQKLPSQSLTQEELNNVLLAREYANNSAEAARQAIDALQKIIEQVTPFQQNYDFLESAQIEVRKQVAIVESAAKVINDGFFDIQKSVKAAQDAAASSQQGVADAKAILDAIEGADTTTKLATHVADAENPHKVTKAQIGLDKVENKTVAEILADAKLTGEVEVPTPAENSNSQAPANTKWVRGLLAVSAGAPFAPVSMTAPANNEIDVGTGGSYTFVAKLRGYAADRKGAYSDYGIPILKRAINFYRPDAPSVIYRSVEASGEGNEIPVVLANVPLSPSTVYICDMTFTDVLGNSVTTPKIAFATASVAASRPKAGDAFGGGTFAGQMRRANGDIHDVIVAPKAGGEWAGVAWDTSETPSLTRVTSRTEAADNTATLSALGAQYAAARLCEELELGGKADWTLPTYDMLEIAYRALKPSAATNSASNVGGVNPNSVPTGDAYTSASPGQTTVVNSRLPNGSEAFEGSLYWSSVEAAQGTANFMSFANGSQSAARKTNLNYVRAFRTQLAA